ncbi:hypothetical protein LXL04_008830 [Taraxacum kok-saghyz]
MKVAVNVHEAEGMRGVLLLWELVKKGAWFREFVGACGSTWHSSTTDFREGIWLRERERESRSFENSYIPENPKTPKPLTFSKNRLRGAKNRSNTSPVANKFPKKQLFFFKNLHMCKKQFVHMCISIYNTYLKGFVKKNLKKNAKKKKKIAYMQKLKKKVAHMQKLKKNPNFNDSKRFEESRSRFFERNNGLGDIGNWGSSRVSAKPQLQHIQDKGYKGKINSRSRVVVNNNNVTMTEGNIHTWGKPKKRDNQNYRDSRDSHTTSKKAVANAIAQVELYQNLNVSTVYRLGNEYCHQIRQKAKLPSYRNRFRVER